MTGVSRYVKVTIRSLTHHVQYGKLLVGQVLEVDEVTADRWIRNRIALQAPADAEITPLQTASDAIRPPSEWQAREMMATERARDLARSPQLRVQSAALRQELAEAAEAAEAAERAEIKALRDAEAVRMGSVNAEQDDDVQEDAEARTERIRQQRSEHMREVWRKRQEARRQAQEES